MKTLNNINKINIKNILNNRYYLDAKHIFFALNNTLPHLYNIHPFDYEKGFKFFNNEGSHLVDSIYKSNYLDNKNKNSKYELGYAIIILKDNTVVHIGYSFCSIYSSIENEASILQLSNQLKKFKRRERKKEFEISLINFDGYFSLVDIDIKKTKLNIDLYYNDDFIEVHNIIKTRLNTKNDKGIVLLHGLPGTGKTTYLRYLIGIVKKRVLFVPPSVAANITNPEFISLLLEYPNSLLVIEDAENIIMDRTTNGNSAVSNLLNISDGLLADCLNIQIICTFNMSISKIDSALMRKGRLIAKYNFEKLSIEKAQQLAQHLDINLSVKEAMSLSEICNYNEREFEEKKTTVVGFKQQLTMN
ncbi:MAG: AAA family ATPase [Chitinophagales bacterium]|nr:AAA family ATPase [Chitinophagales bacterium]